MRPTSLVLNCGSSSIKFALFDPGLQRLASGAVTRIGLEGAGTLRTSAGGGTGVERALDVPDHAAALQAVLAWLEDAHGAGDLQAVGHRIVHGGTRYTAPVRVDAAVLEALEALAPLAPLHQPHNVAGIRAVQALRGDLVQVACFDTAFHRDLPEVATRTGLPRRYAAQGIRRYGFHGLSCESILGQLRARAGPRIDAERLVIAHLGNGASMTAVHGGRARETTMSLTPLDGLLMGTRCGELDPGIVLHLLRSERLDLADVEHLLYHQSGLLGVSGISRNMEELLERPHDAAAAEAVASFCYRARRHLGALAAALEGLDRLVFTGGIGGNAPAVRARICDPCAWLGIELDAAANAAGTGRISAETSRVAVEVLETDEERVIAGHVQALLGIPGTS